jgi:hypothetical protein
MYIIYMIYVKPWTDRIELCSLFEMHSLGKQGCNVYLRALLLLVSTKSETYSQSPDSGILFNTRNLLSSLSE